MGSKSLPSIMLEQLGVARATVEDGHEVVPARGIGTPDAHDLCSPATSKLAPRTCGLPRAQRKLL